MRVIHGLDELRSAVGSELGVSDWVLVDQDRINKFAEATGDYQWIHLDVERAGRETPWKSTIAHGYLTLSLVPMLMAGIWSVEGVASSINYGSNKVRFTSPVPAGSRVRGRAVLKAVDDQGPGSVRLTVDLTVEREGQERPVCVAETLSIMNFA